MERLVKFSPDWWLIEREAAEKFISNFLESFFYDKTIELTNDSIAIVLWHTESKNIVIPAGITAITKSKKGSSGDFNWSN